MYVTRSSPDPPLNKLVTPKRETTNYRMKATWDRFLSVDIGWMVLYFTPTRGNAIGNL